MRHIPVTFAITSLGFVVFSGAVAAKPNPACIPDAEFDAEYREDVRSGAHAGSVSKYGDRQLCSGKPFGVRLQEIRDEEFPWEKEDRDRKHLEMMTKAHEEHAYVEAQKKISRIRGAELEKAEHDAALAEAQWRAAVARSKAAQATLIQAQADQQRKRLPSIIPLDATVLSPSVHLGQQEYETVKRQVESIIRNDATSWIGNSYLPNSVHDVQVLSRNVNYENYLLFARFNYRNGNEGWIEIEYLGRQFKCLTFHDDQNKCRQIGDSLSMRNVSNFTTSTASGIMANFIFKFFNS